MPNYNLTRGWTSQSLAPAAHALVNSVTPTQTPTQSPTQSGQTATATPHVPPTTAQNPTDIFRTHTPVGVQSSPGLLSVAAPGYVRPKTLSEKVAETDPYAALRAAAMGKTGLGQTISASAYQFPNAPSFLTDAVNNLNNSGGGAQQNMTNLLLQQILQQQSHPMTEDLHAAETAKKDAENKQAIAEAKAKAAADAHEQELKLTRLRSNGTMTPYSGWTTPIY